MKTANITCLYRENCKPAPMNSLLRKLTVSLLVLCFVSLAPAPLMALGTFAEGWMVVKKIKKIESSGLILTSYEAELIVTEYNPAESESGKNPCDDEKNECYSPVDRVINVSIRDDNSKAVNFLLKKKDAASGGFLIHYKIHKFEPLALSTDFEVLDARDRSSAKPAIADKKTVQKSGGKRNFSVKGNILRLQNQGTVVNTYEGLYLDATTGKVHPFSVTEDNMAKHIWQAMTSSTPYHIGVSVSYVKAVRESNYDIFEINYNGPAGTVEAPKTGDK